MRVLDKEGRLFGKVNVVDFSIIVLLILIIPFFVSIYIILDKNPVMVPYKWIKIKAVTFTIPEIADMLKPGDISLDQYGKPDAKILHIVKKDVPTQEKYNAIFTGEVNKSYQFMETVFLELELRCTKSAEGEPWYFRRNPLFVSVDCRFPFITSRYEINFYVLQIEDERPIEGDEHEFETGRFKK